MKFRRKIMNYLRSLMKEEEGAGIIEIVLGIVIIVGVGFLLYAKIIVPLTGKTTDFGEQANVRLERSNKMMQDTNATYISQVKDEISAGDFTVTLLDASSNNITATISTLPDDGLVTLTNETKDTYSKITSKTYKILPD